MIRKSDIALTEPAHQPLKSLVVIFWNSFGGLIRSFWPVLLYFFISSNRTNNWLLLFGSAGLALISFFFGTLRYYHFLYHVENNNLVISSGLFTRVTRNIPFERIQSIRLEQKFIHRILNLFLVRIDTAGTSKEEIEIPALDYETANQLKEYIAIQNRARAKRRKELGRPPVVEKESLVFQLSLIDIMKLGITANHIRNFFIILGVLLGISTQLGEFDSQYRIDRWIEYAINNSGKFQFEWNYLLLIPFIVSISIIVSLFFSLLANYNLKVHKTTSGYRVNHGLINRNEHFAPYKKIQIFRWVISPLRRLLGLYSVRIKQASSSEISVKKSILVPGARIEDVRLFLDRVFRNGRSENTSRMEISEKMLYRYFIYFILIPVGLMMLSAYLTSMEGPLYLAVIWIILVSWGIIRYYNSWRIIIGESYLQLERGVISMTRDRIFMHKLQGVRLYQTPYQVRNELANLELQTAAGDLAIPYLPLDDARDLANYLLYKVESSRKAWM